MGRDLKFQQEIEETSSGLTRPSPPTAARGWPAGTTATTSWSRSPGLPSGSLGWATPSLCPAPARWATEHPRGTARRLLSDSEIDKAGAQGRAMRLEDAAAYVRTW